MVGRIRRQVLVGVDLGQSRDYTALAVVERAEMAGEWDAATYAYRKVNELRVRHVERAPLGTPYYPEITERVRKLTKGMEACTVAVDATGVGRPVVDMLRWSRPGYRLMPVVITGGMGEGMSQGYATVPKRDLLGGVQALLERRELKIAAGMKWAGVLREEMGSMKVRTKGAGREEMEGAEHDDLVVAVALACWAGKKVYGEQLAGQWGWCARDVVERGGRMW